MSERPVVDRAALGRLREWGGADLPAKMIALFLEHAPQRLEQIRRGIEGGELRTAEMGAHSLKSTSGNVGALELSGLAAEAEDLAQAGDVDALAALVPRMERALQEARRELETLLEGGGTMKPRIAVVEDNPDNRLLVRALLEPAYEVVEYETGPQFIADLGHRPPGLVLLDISLPEMDGVEVLRWIRSQEGFRGLPVVALTAHAMAGDREKYLSLGFDDYLSKPIVEDAHLLELVKRWVGPES